MIDELICEGFGKCERIAPDLFQLDDKGTAHALIVGDLNPDQLQRATMAVRLCPVKAISLVGLEPKGKTSE